MKLNKHKRSAQLFALQHIIQFAIVSVFKISFCWLLGAGCWLHSDRHRTRYGEQITFACQFYAYLKCESQSKKLCFHKILKWEEAGKNWKRKNINTCFMEWIGAQNTLNILIFLECERNFSEFFPLNWMNSKMKNSCDWCYRVSVLCL